MQVTADADLLKGVLTNRHTFLLIITTGQLRATADVDGDNGRSSQLDHSKALDVYFSELYWSSFQGPVRKYRYKNKTARHFCRSRTHSQPARTHHHRAGSVRSRTATQQLLVSNEQCGTHARSGRGPGSVATVVSEKELKKKDGAWADVGWRHRKRQCASWHSTLTQLTVGRATDPRIVFSPYG